MLRRDSSDRVEFITLSMWESEEAIRAFAGEDIEAAVLYPEDETVSDRWGVERDAPRGGRRVEPRLAAPRWRSPASFSLPAAAGMTRRRSRARRRLRRPSARRQSRGPTFRRPVARPALAGCRTASGRIVYVEQVDPDGDGDAHFVLAGDDSITGPGISVIDVKPSLHRAARPRGSPQCGRAGPHRLVRSEADRGDRGSRSLSRAGGVRFPSANSSALGAQYVGVLVGRRLDNGERVFLWAGEGVAVICQELLHGCLLLLESDARNLPQGIEPGSATQGQPAHSGSHQAGACAPAALRSSSSHLEPTVRRSSPGAAECLPVQIV